MHEPVSTLMAQTQSLLAARLLCRAMREAECLSRSPQVVLTLAERLLGSLRSQ
jgi:hypothetical protein